MCYNSRRDFVLFHKHICDHNVMLLILIVMVSADKSTNAEHRVSESCQSSSGVDVDAAPQTEFKTDCLAIGRVIVKLNWTTVVIVYDKTTEYAINVLTTLISGEILTYHLLQTEQESEDVQEHLFTGTAADNYNYVVYSSTQSLNRVLYKVSGLNDRIYGLRHYSKWLVFSHCDNIAELTQLKIDNVAVVVPVRQDPQIRYDVITLLWKPGSREFAKVGKINQQIDVQLTEDVFPNLRFGFNQRQLLVATNRWPPFVFLYTSQHGQITYAGHTVELLEILSKYMNFTYNITEPVDREWGRQVNGSWTGLIGMLDRKEVDLVAAPLVSQFQREEVVDFSVNYFNDDLGFIYKKPDPHGQKWKTYLAPFKWEVHVCLLGVFVAGCVVALLVERLHPQRSPEGIVDGTMNTVCGLLSIVLRQGGQRLPQHLSSKITSSFWWFFTTIVAAVYCGNLIAFLTVNLERLPVKSVQDLVGQAQYRWGVPGGSAYVTLLESSNKTEYKQLWAGITEFAKTDPDVLSLYSDVHVNKVLAGQYVYLSGESTMSYYFTNNCAITLINSRILTNAYSIALPNNSPYTLEVSERINSLHASGILHYLKMKYFNRSVCNTVKRSVKPAGVLDAQGAFYALAVGVGGASLCLVAELGLTRWHLTHRS